MKLQKIFTTYVSIALMLFAGWAQALDIQPYTATALQQAQAAGKPVAVHFHADWCSTCVNQRAILTTCQR